MPRTLETYIDSKKYWYEMSLDDISRQVGVDRRTLQNWRSGRSIPRLDAAMRLSEVLGVPLDELSRAIMAEQRH